MMKHACNTINIHVGSIKANITPKQNDTNMAHITTHKNINGAPPTLFTYSI